MIQRAASSLADLYESEETAWLEAMSVLIRQGRVSELDYANLAEYLSDMAARDRREVQNRLTRLIDHLLKWTHQPKQRTRIWRGKIIRQRQEFRLLIEQSVLREHAEAVLEEAYADAVKVTIVATGIGAAAFPRRCPYELDQLLDEDFWG